MKPPVLAREAQIWCQGRDVEKGREDRARADLKGTDKFGPSMCVGLGRCCFTHRFTYFIVLQSNEGGTLMVFS